MSGNTSWSNHALEITKYETHDPSGIVYSPSEYEWRMYQAAAEVVTDLRNYTVSYIVDNIALTISPDPETSINDERDMAFIVMVGLKAACTIAKKDWADSLGQAIKIRDGDSSIDTSVRSGARKDAMDSKHSVCSRYEALLEHINLLANIGQHGQFVVGQAWEGQQGRWTYLGGYTTYMTRARTDGGSWGR